MRKILFWLVTLVIAFIVIILLGAMYNQFDVQSTGDAVAVDPDNQVLRTSDERFDSLEDFLFAPNYVEIEDAQFGSLRIHYLDEGPVDGPIVLLLHGQATWSYSYRKMIPLFTAEGFRVIVPDLVGFGRSDKPADWNDHTFQKHVNWLAQTLAALDIKNSTGFLFDWGGYFGLPVAVAEPGRFARLVLVTTTVPRGDSLVGAAWTAGWRRYILKPEIFPISGMVSDMTRRDLNEQTLRGLDAPYPDESYKGGPRRMPMMIPATFLHPAAKPNHLVWKKLAEWEKPTLTLISEQLASAGFNPEVFHEQIPGTQGQTHQIYPDTGFFLIEENPAELAQRTIEFIHAN